MESQNNRGTVVAVCKKAQPGIPKISVEAIHLMENYGVEEDYHAGKFVRHRCSPSWLIRIFTWNPA
jgi:hypothetical protein